jgi:hypothetical protein
MKWEAARKQLRTSQMQRPTTPYQLDVVEFQLVLDGPIEHPNLSALLPMFSHRKSGIARNVAKSK